MNADTREIFLQNIKEIIQQLLSENYGYYYLRSRMNRLQDENVRVLVTGSSYAVHGILDGTNNAIMNLSGTSQDIFCDYYLARQIIERRKELGLPMFQAVVIMLGYYALFDDLSSGKVSRELMRSVYEPLLHTKHNADFELYDRWKSIKQRFPFLEAEHCEICDEWIINYLNEKNYFNDVYHREDNVEEQYRGLVWENLSLDEKIYYAKTRTEKHNKLLKHTQICTENVELLTNYLQFICEHGIRPIVVIPPFTKEYCETLDKRFETGLWKALNDLPFAIDYYDFNQSTEFVECDFFDMDHLNEKGAAKLTSHLI